MSDSTIDDALRLLEIGKGSPDRLKIIIETFEERSLIPLQDRKYVEALVQQYLTPRHRIKIKKIEPIKKEPPITPRTLKSTKPEFSFEKKADTSDDKIDLEQSELDSPTSRICPECESQNSASNNFCNNCGSRMTKSDTTTKPASSSITKNESEFEKYEREYLERENEKTGASAKETGVEEKYVGYIEAKPRVSKKSDKKFVGIGIGILALIVIVGGGVIMIGDTDFSTTEVDERLTCDNSQVLVSATKIPGFPNPEKDLQYYLDRYNNEPNYKDWFDRNFPDQTIQDVLVSQTSVPVATSIPGFPNPEKDLQYYIDRYNNEPNYKDWFDRNFPDQTIQSVVCS